MEKKLERDAQRCAANIQQLAKHFSLRSMEVALGVSRRTITRIVSGSLPYKTLSNTDVQDKADRLLQTALAVGSDKATKRKSTASQWWLTPGDLDTLHLSVPYFEVFLASAESVVVASGLCMSEGGQSHTLYPALAELAERKKVDLVGRAMPALRFALHQKLFNGKEIVTPSVVQLNRLSVLIPEELLHKSTLADLTELFLRIASKALLDYIKAIREEGARACYSEKFDRQVEIMSLVNKALLAVRSDDATLKERDYGVAILQNAQGHEPAPLKQSKGADSLFAFRHKVHDALMTTLTKTTYWCK